MAAKPEVTHEDYMAGFAGVNWSLEQGDAYVEGAVIASITKAGADVYVDQAVWREGQTIATLVEVTTGFTFTMNSGRLSSATLRANDLPAWVCTFDEDHPEGECGWSETPVDIDLSWTASGPITRSADHSRYSEPGLRLNLHNAYVIRPATLAGQVAGGSISMSGADMETGNIGRAKTLKIERCTGEVCEELG